MCPCSTPAIRNVQPWYTNYEPVDTYAAMNAFLRTADAPDDFAEDELAH